MKVFIDGENLRHRLVQLLLADGLIDHSDAPLNLDVIGLIAKANGERPEEIFYYTTHIDMPEGDLPDEMRAHIARIQEDSRLWTTHLADQGITIIKAGGLKVRNSNRCEHCGKKTLVLHEKGVDVRLATDVVMAAIKDSVDHVVILSSDADMIPALQVAHHAGTKVSYLCFEEETNAALSAEADETLTYSRQDVMNSFRSITAFNGK